MLACIRIYYPLDLTTLDDDYNEIKKTVNKENWTFTNLYYDCDSISMLYYDFDRTFKDTDTRTLIIHGIENGINAQSSFKRIDNKWMMTEYVDIST